ncbi:EndoU domain-containing protein [Flavobacterium sp. HSC-61S13]|uniref:EndoU domain-containing protein n=1 Tax=Flavobacterium sp. HSC-61S13 TaxID=2910963 RepID=UPI00209F5CBB|nr:EndoU domain-containing protein [Flavobacterium sp. HSC-61S13]MCP1997086.1 hypothetical protein [Flavobacterium sp. HSC-61S13]
MDGVSTVEEVTEKNRQLLADLMLVLCSSHTYQGVKSSGAVYRIGRDYKVYSRIYPLDSDVKDRFFLQQMQRKQDQKLERYPDDIPRLSPGKEVDTSYFIESDSGGYHHPLEAVFLIDMDAQDQVIYTVPAIYVKAMADEGVWKDVILGLRMGGNLLAIVLGVASLGTSNALLLAVAVADISLATTDILVVIAEDELMKTQEGQEFLRNWNAIQPLLLMGTSAPLMARSAVALVNNTFNTGAKLLSKATTPATKNFLRASLLKMVFEKNIANFTKSSLQIIDDGYGVYQASLSIIKIRDATRLQQQGVLFVKGEMTVGKTTKSGIVVLHKGEILASGEARAVRKSLSELWKAKGERLAYLLDNAYRRVRALEKWKSKFDLKFHNHFDGEFKIKIFDKIFILKGAGGHNHEVIGFTVKIRKYLTKPVDDMPFDALISVRYRVQGRLGQWIDKEAKSTMFPINWDITRVKQEIALVYDEMIKVNIKLKSANNKFQFPAPNGKFRIQIEVDQLGNITNAFPIL